MYAFLSELKSEAKKRESMEKFQMRWDMALISGYHWYSVWGIIDTRFWVSLILGYWYLGIIDTRALGIVDT